jgi:hypothetical protein
VFGGDRVDEAGIAAQGSAVPARKGRGTFCTDLLCLSQLTEQIVAMMGEDGERLRRWDALTHP